MLLLNISTYIDNAVFDNKNDIGENEKTNYIISARILRNIAERILKEVKEKDYIRLVELLREIDHDIYVAQFEDLNQLTKEREFKDYNEFLKAYLHRCEWITGRFMENICKIGAILGNSIEEQKEDLGKIGKNIGIIVQIINDIGDFVLPQEGVYDYEKVYQDQFSDIKSGKLTLPVYYVLQFGSEEEKKIIKKVLGNQNIINDELKEVARVIVESGALTNSKNLAKEYAKEIKEILSNFEYSESKNCIRLMSQMWRTNKYLAGLKNLFGDSKRKEENIILVNEKDNPIGIEEKLKVHKQGKLHRAFSIFVFNSNGDLLIQQRNKTKYHCGGLWANTTCSHPRTKESVIEASHRRLKEEMGFDCQLKKLFKFHYKASFDNGLTENEIDTVLVGFYDGNPKINKQEVSDYKWISLKELEKDIIDNPNKYAIWFKIAIKRFLKLKNENLH